MQGVQQRLHKPAESVQRELQTKREGPWSAVLAACPITLTAVCACNAVTCMGRKTA